MRGMRLALAAAVCAASAFLPAALADPHSEAIWAADAAAGAELYAAQCVACHGVAGNSLVPEQPILAAQHPEYIADQMFKYRSKERENALMYPFAQNLSDQQIYELAAYLGIQNAGLSGATDRELAEAGERIYRLGLPELGVPGCTGCHGPAGLGIPPEFPRLSGQHAAYTAAALRELRSGARVNEAMNAISHRLIDEHIEALAEYISGLY